MARPKKQSSKSPCMYFLLITFLLLVYFASRVIYISHDLDDGTSEQMDESAMLHKNTTRIKNCSLAIDAPNSCPPLSHKFRIFVFTYARPDGLSVTLRSILNADYSKAGNSSVDLEVFFDFRRKPSSEMKAKQDATISMLNDVVWPHGRYRVHRRCVNAGLRHSIMEAWYPTSDREVAAFFEDDVEVSPFWFAWTHDALKRYAPIRNGAIQADPHFIGVSLFRPVYDELSLRETPVDNGYSPFLLQQPCSWGAVFLPVPWRTFRSFFDDVKDKDMLVTLPKGRKNPSSNRWDYATSWKKYLIYHMYKHGQYVMYPNFPQRLVLSTSRLLKGEHPTPQREYFVLPLVQKSDLEDASVAESLKNFPIMDEMKVFDVLFTETAGVQQLPNYKNLI